MADPTIMAETVAARPINADAGATGRLRTSSGSRRVARRVRPSWTGSRFAALPGGLTLELYRTVAGEWTAEIGRRGTVLGRAKAKTVATAARNAVLDLREDQTKRPTAVQRRKADATARKALERIQ